MSDATARMRLDGEEKMWSIPLDDDQWRALAKLRPRMTLGFLLASGPHCLRRMIDFSDSLGRRRPSISVGRNGKEFWVCMRDAGIPASPTFHERAVAGSRKFTAEYTFEFGRWACAPGDFIPETWGFTVTERGRFLEVPESRCGSPFRRLADAIGLPVPPELAGRSAESRQEIPWVAADAPWPLFSKWLDDQRTRIMRVALRFPSIPAGTIPRLVDASADVEIGRETEVAFGDSLRGPPIKIRVGSIVGRLKPRFASVILEARPGDAKSRSGFVQTGWLKGTAREVAHDGMVHGEWERGKLTLWASGEMDWGPFTRGLEAG